MIIQWLKTVIEKDNLLKRMNSRPIIIYMPCELFRLMGALSFEFFYQYMTLCIVLFNFVFYTCTNKGGPIMVWCHHRCCPQSLGFHAIMTRKGPETSMFLISGTWSVKGNGSLQNFTTMCHTPRNILELILDVVFRII